MMRSPYIAAALFVFASVGTASADPSSIAAKSPIPIASAPVGPAMVLGSRVQVDVKLTCSALPFPGGYETQGCFGSGPAVPAGKHLLVSQFQCFVITSDGALSAMLSIGRLKAGTIYEEVYFPGVYALNENAYRYYTGGGAVSMLIPTGQQVKFQGYISGNGSTLAGSTTKCTYFGTYVTP